MVRWKKMKWKREELGGSSAFVDEFWHQPGFGNLVGIHEKSQPDNINMRKFFWFILKSRRFKGFFERKSLRNITTTLRDNCLEDNPHIPQRAAWPSKGIYREQAKTKNSRSSMYGI